MTQTEHHLPDAVHALELLPNLPRLVACNPLDAAQALRFFFQNVQGVVPKGIHNPGGGGSSNSLDRSGGQVFQHCHCSGRLGALKRLHLELRAKIRMAAPVADHPELLSGAHPGDGPHHGDQLLAVVELQYRISIFFIPKDNPLHRAGHLQKGLFIHVGSSHMSVFGMPIAPLGSRHPTKFQFQQGFIPAVCPFGRYKP